MEKRPKRRRKSTTYGMSTIPLHLMLLPAVILLFIYRYLPMGGLVIAFQNFDITMGIRAFWESEWVGFDNFMRIFGDDAFTRALRNTLTIAIGKMITMYFFPIIIALMLNEIRISALKRGIQTLVYLPFFLSWVILAGIIRDILGMDGIVNTLFFSQNPRFFLGDPSLFQPMLIITNIWREFGYATIVYLAAITSVDPEQYEAAMVDGATRLRQTWHVTLPGMRPIIVLTGVLSLGGILNAGFDQVFNLYSVPVRATGDIIDTLVFRTAMVGGQFHVGTAIGLFNSAVGFLLIITANGLAKKFAGYQVF
ncbi:MAG: ABC transporter permease subunit [Defluviitaleaceae bacterium]|nr:ABC transporter permease subunit [Defluviitaleaceae bacterium]